MMMPNQAETDLQKAIDDITNTTSVEPMFTDPVAAPSTVPEGDDGSLGEAIGPFPEPQIEIPEPKIEAAEIPEINFEETLIPDAEAADTETPQDDDKEKSVAQVKEAALRDLMPLLEKMNINPSQKFRIYRDAFRTLHDYTILEPAYNAAKEITDEKERGEALLKIVNEIDQM